MLTSEKKGRYITILADGKFHETVPAGSEGAEEREYETSDGKKGTKWERTYTKISATITDVSFHEGDYGKNINIPFRDDEGNEVTVSVNTTSNFGEDIMKKLPNVDFSKQVTLVPFAFEDEKKKGRMVRGVTFYQDGNKIKNHFKSDDGKLLHGFPPPENEGKNFDSDDWKAYFIKIRKFLVKYIEANVCTKFSKDTPVKMAYPEGPNPEDIPF